MRAAISPRTQSIILSGVAVAWLGCGLALPFEYAVLLPLGMVGLGVVSFLIRCPRCRQPALERHVRILGETWTVGWFLAPRTCLRCGQDLTMPGGAHGATAAPPGSYPPAASSPRTLATYIAVGGAASAGGALLAWRHGEVMVAGGGLALAAGLCLASGVIWYRARRSP
jgi:hypothetical protein